MRLLFFVCLNKKAREEIMHLGFGLPRHARHQLGARHVEEGDARLGRNSVRKRSLPSSTCRRHVIDFDSTAYMAATMNMFLMVC